MIKQAILDKLRMARPEDMGRDVIEFFGLKPGERLDWNATELNIGDEAIPMADVIESIEKMREAIPARGVEIKDLV